jgi:3-deoxy-D-manno-octulosonate 8-phosphate phosphatase (KDO 8-P phosphatase)
MLRSDAEIAAPITCLITDVDGVLTDGRIHYDDHGNEWKSFHVRDGFAIKQWMAVGLQFGIVTARSSGALERRVGELGIRHVVQSSRNKLESTQTMLAEMGGDFSTLAYVGDDVPDLAVMQRSCLAVAPADGSADSRSAADWTLKTMGGHGAIREVIERLLRAKGLWNVSPDADTLRRPGQV